MESITKAAADKSYLYTFQQDYDAYAQSLFNIGKKKESLSYIRKAYEKSDQKNTRVNLTYSKILNSLKMHDEALPIRENLVRDGKATPELKSILQR